MKTFIAALFVGLLMISHAWAEADANYRYKIQGHILDENEQGMDKQEVKVYKGLILLDIGRTDSAGFYSLQLKLHESDNKQILRLKAGANEAEIKVILDPENSSTQRTHKANFVGGKYIEGDLTGFRFPTWIYPIVILIVISLLAIKLEKRRKKKIQQKKDKLSGRQSTSSHHAKKKRRKKH